MKLIKTSLLNASLIALSFASTHIHAASGTSQYVDDVDLAFTGMAATINIENTAVNKHLNALDLKVKTNNLNFDIAGTVTCKGTNVGLIASTAYFGPVNISGVGINSAATLYQKAVPVAEDDGGIVEYTPTTFTVPVNNVKNGHPALRVDPLEELNKKLQAHIQGGGTALDFYKHDQDIVLHRPISLGAACGKNNNPNKVSSGYETKNHTIQIKYKGDPALNETPVLNAQLQGNMANQVQAGEQPFKLIDAEFMANIPHAFGKCIPDQNPVLRVNYHMSGTQQGEMDFRINSYSNQYADYGVYHEELGILKNPKLAGNNSYFDFEFPLKQMLSQQKYSWMAISNNTTYNHNMVLQMRYRPQFGQMTQWKDVDTAIFKHRCVPQLNNAIPQNGIGGYQKDNGGNVLEVKPIRATPTPKPLDKAAPLPAPSPKPAGIRAPTPAPTPKPADIRAPLSTPEPLTIKAVEPEPEAPLRLKSTQ